MVLISKRKLGYCSQWRQGLGVVWNPGDSLGYFLVLFPKVKVNGKLLRFLSDLKNMVGGWAGQ